MNAQAPWNPAPAARKKRSGCLVALAIVAGIAVLGLVVGGLLLVKLARDVGLTGSDFNAIAQETKRSTMAPGYDEVSRLNCTAYIIDAATMPRLLDLYRNLEFRVEQPVDVNTIVECDGMLLFDPPSCDSVAHAYVNALGGKAASPFRVVVVDTKREVACNSKYGEAGVLVSQSAKSSEPISPPRAP